LAAVLTPELKRRIAKDRLVKKTFDIIEILAKPESREKFSKRFPLHIANCLMRS